MTRAVVIISCYIAAQMLSDIASLRIVLFLGLSIDAGAFIYPITFTLRDLVHKTIGKRGVQTLILTAVVINLFMAFVFWFVSKLPADPMVGPQSEFALVLSPVWRIVIASIAAEALAEFIDTEAYQRWAERFGKKHQWGRVLASNAVAIPIDSLVFSWGAFGGVLPVAVVWSIFVSNMLIKGVTTVVSVPLIYAVPDRQVMIVDMDLELRLTEGVATERDT